MGTEKHRIASRKRWDKYTPEQRSVRMRDIAEKRWAKTTIEERRAFTARINGKA